MNLAKGPARIGFVAALLALMVGPMLFSASSAHAQVSLPAKYYGTGLAAGDTVAYSVDGAECGSTTADASGGWAVDIAAGDCDGAVAEGVTINFSVNGDQADQYIAWSDGGSPPDRANGITLTVAAMPAMPDPVWMTWMTRRHG